MRTLARLRGLASAVFARADFAGRLTLLAALALAPPAFCQTADSFNPDPNSGPGPMSFAVVEALAVQPDGRILVGGGFTRLAGQPRTNLGRLYPDGSLDTAFNPGPSGEVVALALQTNDAILVAGSFTNLAGQAHQCLGRLEPDGTGDASFNPTFGSSESLVGIAALAIQPDGKVLVGGGFGSLNGQGPAYLGRLNSDGTLDTGFKAVVNPWTVLQETAVTCLALQTNGQILVGGTFAGLGNQAHEFLGRLNADGTVDRTFNPSVSSARGLPMIECLVLQPDGQILVGGSFTNLGGHSCTNLGRLTATGTLDTSFNPAPNGQVSALALQADGRILVAGSFNRLGGISRTNVARLNSSGSGDTSFSVRVSLPGYPFASGANVNVLALQSDGRILVGGNFELMGGQWRTNLARLTNAAATQALNYDGTNITWLRGAAAAEVSWARFDWSTNGLAWSNLGAGVRIAGGWQFAAPSLPSGADIRALGLVPAGYDDCSSWYVETISGPPVIIYQPVSQTNGANTTATFFVGAAGTAPLGFQWFKGGVALAGSPLIMGTQTAELTLSNVFGAQAGGYSVVVSNALGAVTSQVATLTVLDPVITLQPASQTASQGRLVTLSVSAAGTPTLAYQWRKNGADLPPPGGPTLSLPAVQRADAGDYSVVVSNALGCVTSAVAVLTVNCASVDGWAPTDSGEEVDALVVQPDGRIVVAGLYADSVSQFIVRFADDGSPDSTFNPAADGQVDALAVQPDGKLLLGGSFSNLGGQPCPDFGRLNPDGSLDVAFCPGGAAGPVFALILQADGRILVGGEFTTLGGQPCQYLGRLNPDGTPDITLVSGASAPVFCLALQPDGAILVGGQFSSLGGQSRQYLGRLNPDGSLDAGFSPSVNGLVYCLVPQADGKILVGGSFTTLCGQPRSLLGRLNPDGSLDTGFNPSASAGSPVYFVALQTDGKILVAGQFTILGGQLRSFLGRLNPDGSVDLTFDPGASSWVDSLALQADGSIVVGGAFTSLGGVSRACLGRLVNTDPATQSLTLAASSVTWLRGGASPEVWRTTFDLSTNGVDWLSLGPGTRISGGWQLTNLSLPSFGIVRARGFVAAGGGNTSSSSYFVESRTPSLAVVPNDSSFGLSAGSFGFNLAGPPGQTAVIEASADLLNWCPVATNCFGAGPFYFSDTNSAAFPWRFYRARLQ